MKNWLSTLRAKVEADTNINATIDQGYHQSLESIKQWETNWKNKCDALNQYTAGIADQLGVKPFVKFVLYPEIIRVYYLNNSPMEIENTINKLFELYQKKIDEINNQLAVSNNQEKNEELKEEKLKTIANLYQCLEWVHPFLDGQGRTDLVLLAMLLAKEGFNPAVLTKPYTSTTALLPEWKIYLNQGINLWKDLKNEQEMAINFKM